MVDDNSANTTELHSVSRNQIKESGEDKSRRFFLKVTIACGAFVGLDIYTKGKAHETVIDAYRAVESLGLKEWEYKRGSRNLTFQSEPRISKQKFISVLQEYNSPALSEANKIYDILRSNNIDPAVQLAIFIHETSAGNTGINNPTTNENHRNWGALRSNFNPSGFQRFNNYTESIKEQINTLKALYIGIDYPGKETPSDAPQSKNMNIIDWGMFRYAPSADSNKPDDYVKDIYKQVNQWRKDEFENSSKAALSYMQERVTRQFREEKSA